MGPGARRSGSLRWKTGRLIAESALGQDRSAPLTAAGGLVCAADSGALYALSADRGIRKSTYGLGTDAAETTAPTVEGQVVYVGADNSVHAVRATTGKRLWTLHTDDDDLGVGQPIFRDGALYTVGYRAHSHSLYKVSARTGDIVWKKTEESLERFAGSSGATVAVAGDTVYTHNGSVVQAWQADSGRVRWQRDTGDTLSLQDGPVVAGGRWFACASDTVSDVRYVYALAADTGKELWKARFAGAMDTDSDIEGVQAVSGGVALLYTGPNAPDAGLRALDTETGKVKWERRFDSSVLSPPATAGGRVYIAADSVLYVLRADTGKTEWRSTLDALARQRPVIAGGTVYFSAPTGKIYAVWA
ncbi:PQQ-binding-like beta-propeller repeat protein [Streptomyces armeniacus]|uniref:outer membrane protein assembly factor BamB family protein n=1 Tax=Streptomyces armeniacus TaxID=83291 RepID=UPI001AD84C47|nr:PQQ-binding-like beta-propeller repeat protein [Streptomyces armeniacus]